jgi:hypothetical protein
MATKIAIGVVGDCCGKSTYIQRVTTGHFQDNGRRICSKKELSMTFKP